MPGILLYDFVPSETIRDWSVFDRGIKMFGRFTSGRSGLVLVATTMAIAFGCSGQPPSNTCSANGVGGVTGTDPCTTGGAGTGGAPSLGGSMGVGDSGTEVADATAAGGTNDDPGTVTPAGIVSFASGGESLQVLAVPGQVMVFFSPEVTADNVSQLIEGIGAVRLAEGLNGNRYLVQVPVGSEGQYIASVTGDGRILGAYPNVISSNLAATVLEDSLNGGCRSQHALGVMAAYAAGSNGGVVACSPVSAYTNLCFDSAKPCLPSTFQVPDAGTAMMVYYHEYDVNNKIETTLALGRGGGDSQHVNVSFGPRVDSVELALCKANPTVCSLCSSTGGGSTSCCLTPDGDYLVPTNHPCLGQAQSIAITGYSVAWTSRLHVLATYCGQYFSTPDTCNAVLAMAAGNDSLPLTAPVIGGNAIIVGVPPSDRNRIWNGNYVPGTDKDFVLGANSAAVAEAGGTSFASPFVLGLVSQKADDLRQSNVLQSNAVADAEALCMVKNAAMAGVTLDDNAYGNIADRFRCCLDQPGTTWNPNAQPPACECPLAGQTWNANAQPPACQCPPGTTKDAQGCKCPDGSTWNATANACPCPSCQTWNPSAQPPACECPSGTVYTGIPAQNGNLSLTMSQYPANSTISHRQDGSLVLTGTDPKLNVVDIDTSQLGNLVVNFPAGSCMVVNVTGTTVAWSGGDTIANGLDCSTVNDQCNRIAFNMYEATNVAMSGTTVQSLLLAPFAAASVAGSCRQPINCGGITW